MTRKTCWEKAAELLARRDHFRLELERKLVQRNFEPQEIQQTLEKLERLDWVNDRRTAEVFIKEKRRRSHWGAFRLRRELHQRGVGGDVIHEILADSGGVDEGLALAAAEKWRRGKPRGSREALGRHLARRGFSQHVILTILNQEGDSTF